MAGKKYIDKTGLPLYDVKYNPEGQKPSLGYTKLV